MTSYLPTRRGFISGLLATAAVLPATPTRAEGPFVAKVLFGYQRGSFSARAFSNVRDAFARELGGSVEEEYLVSDRAVAQVAAAGPSEPTLLVIADFEPVAVPIVYPDVQPRPDLQPIAKLSLGISVALVVSASGKWRSWDDLKALPHDQPLRIATFGARSSAGLFADIAAKIGGFAIEQVERQSTMATAAEVIDGHVDGAVVTTFELKHLNLLTNRSLIPILTSGAERARGFPDTPTLGEVSGDRKLAFTTSVSAFASTAMQPSLAHRLTEAFLRAGKDQTSLASAVEMNFPFQVDGPDIVRETLERNRRVAIRYRDILRGMKP